MILETVEFKVHLLNSEKIQLVVGNHVHGEYPITAVPDSLLPLLIQAFKSKADKASEIVRKFEEGYQRGRTVS